MKSLKALALLGSVFATTALPAHAQEGFIGQVKMFAFSECPRGWVAPEGQFLPISAYEQAYEYMGTTFGGDGVTTFQVPNLDAHFVEGAGAGPGLTPVAVGGGSGNLAIPMTLAHLPTHSHDFLASSVQPDSVTPQANTLGTFVNAPAYAEASSDVVQMNADTVGIAGDNDGVDVVQPFMALQYCLNLTAGVMPILSEED